MTFVDFMVTLGGAPVVRLLLAGDPEKNVWRLKRIFDAAFAVFGDANSAVAWIVRRHPAMGNRAPVHGISSDDQLAEVLKILRSELPLSTSLPVCVASLAGTVGGADEDLAGVLHRLEKIWAAICPTVWQHPDLAFFWLTSPCRALGGDEPLFYADTDERTQKILDLINQIDHGELI